MAQVATSGSKRMSSSTQIWEKLQQDSGIQLVGRDLISLVSASPAGSGKKEFLHTRDGQVQMLCHDA